MSSNHRQQPRSQRRRPPSQPPADQPPYREEDTYQYDYDYEYEYQEYEPRIATSSKIMGLILLVAAVFLVPKGYNFFKETFYLEPITEGVEVTLVVEKGDGAKQVGEKLVAIGAANTHLPFVTKALATNQASKIQPGEYTFTTGADVDTIIAMVTAAKEALPTFKVLIPEGLTISQVFDRIAKAPGSSVTHQQLLDAQKDLKVPDWVPQQTIPQGGNPFEGLLWPATYDFVEGSKAVDILQKLIDTTTQNVKAVGPAKRGDLTEYQTLVLASLIEREARVADERPIISSVIHNRIERPMRLQIDATVVYGIWVATGEYKPRLLLKDYEFVSPWSTYTNDGLPPTPISNVGRASLEAAANPAESKFYYYVVNNPEAGTHTFAETSGQHEQNVAAARRAAAENKADS